MVKTGMLTPKPGKTTPDTITQHKSTQIYKLMGEVLIVLGRIGADPTKLDKLMGWVR